MLAFIEITINIVYLAAIVLASVSIGFLLSRAQLQKQKTAISRLEVEMLQSHSEILQLQKELSDKESLQSKTPIFSIKDSAAESVQEQLPGSRLSKKIVGGGGKSSS
jgi:hypothetical protein